MPTPAARSLGFLLALGWLAPGGSPAPARGGEPTATPPALVVPTYNRDVAPIVRARCQACHRRDQVGPFPLETFEQARKRGRDIVAVVEERRMPPWKPVAGFGPALAHDRSLPIAEVAMLRRWLDAGLPEGDGRDLAPSPAPRDGWTLGTPDLVLKMPEEFRLAARGPDVYRCFVLPTALGEDVYVSAVEYRPGNPRAVHHVMALVETAGQARLKDAADPGPGYTSFSGAGVDIVGDLGGWAPGNDAVPLPDGVGRSLPKGADVILQVHYHPSGKPEVDRTRIGLYLARRPVRQTLQWVGVTTRDIHLPPDRTRIKVAARWTAPVDMDLLSIAPHMHQLGREMRITVTHPSGRGANLIRVDDWDPGWQGTYSFEKPVRLVRGSIVEVVAHYDNTAHARNPNHPPKLVEYGQESYDEMCTAYLGVVKVGQDLTLPGQKDDLFAILVDHARRVQYREQFAPIRRKR